MFKRIALWFADQLPPSNLPRYIVPEELRQELRNSVPAYNPVRFPGKIQLVSSAMFYEVMPHRQRGFTIQLTYLRKKRR
jgi:hypothetical protein